MENDFLEYEFFKEATLRICGSLNAHESADSFRDFAKKYFPCDEIFFGFFDHVTSSGIFHAISTDIKNPPYLKNCRYTKSEWKELERSILRDGPVKSFNSPDEVDEAYRTIMKIHKIYTNERSGIGLYLNINNTEIGLMIITCSQRNCYNKTHERLLSLLHDPVAIAMENWKQHTYLLRYQQILQDDCKFFRESLKNSRSEKIIGAEQGLKDVVSMVSKVSKVDSPVMILGDTGVGKEVAANAIHNFSKRSEGPFIKVNCGAIPDNLIDSKLFGHEKGSFTGAVKSHRGLFERASGGTLFLDEIGELPLPAQVRLLRVIQTQELERVGGIESIPIDVRVISATHRNLEEMVKKGTFRQDLWFRLNVFPIPIPSLRDRKSDIPELAHHFAAEKSIELKLHKEWKFTDSGMSRLVNYSWPGNVRELQNVIERELILSLDGNLKFNNLIPLVESIQDEYLQKDEKSDSNVEPLDSAITRAIKKALNKSGGRVQGKGGAADLLNINPNTLRGRMKKLGIEYGSRKNPKNGSE